MTGTEELTAELMSCPFCGDEHPFWDADDTITCNGRGCGASITRMNAESAIAAWNRRAALSQPPSAQEAEPVAMDRMALAAHLAKTNAGRPVLESDEGVYIHRDVCIEAIQALFASPVPALPETGVTTYRPALIRNEEAGFTEIVTEDVPTITGQMEARNVEPILRMGSPRGELLGYRVYDAAPASPLAKRG